MAAVVTDIYVRGGYAAAQNFSHKYLGAKLSARFLSRGNRMGFVHATLKRFPLRHTYTVHSVQRRALCQHNSGQCDIIDCQMESMVLIAMECLTDDPLILKTVLDCR